MEAVLYTSTGATHGTIALHDTLFARPIKLGLIHRLLLLQRNNARVAIAHTLNRGERRGSTRKLGAQKGSGRARQGSVRSPVHKK
jgi:large subunit ribosomal protein L4